MQANIHTGVVLIRPELRRSWQPQGQKHKHTFPAYHSRPPTAESAASSHQWHGDALPAKDSGGLFSQTVQHAVNHTRKAENRVLKLQHTWSEPRSSGQSTRKISKLPMSGEGQLPQGHGQISSSTGRSPDRTECCQGDYDPAVCLRGRGTSGGRQGCRHGCRVVAAVDESMGAGSRPGQCGCGAKGLGSRFAGGDPHPAEVDRRTCQNPSGGTRPIGSQARGCAWASNSGGIGSYAIDAHGSLCCCLWGGGALSEHCRSRAGGYGWPFGIARRPDGHDWWGSHRPNEIPRSRGCLHMQRRRLSRRLPRSSLVQRMPC